ncbi:hypothetical protein PFAG_02921 [Plasmodium falciparum Santa Lucia]|uniref:Uncharacterized protein n=3 Tax=Plasmodium falciparum TaxID=5833 RepID=W7F004_PLAF8|nr:hypothetical protein PFNF135_03084 [Plasmodium falciparum NF135/5.C10]EUR71283.1 hypothetical protein PFBG_03010 [Plasmodium falciparum 7G8]EUT85560.1 hypothetical protein PFAG_02921 [Plasmodium falciparum Santa Lucia]
MYIFKICIFILKNIIVSKNLIIYNKIKKKRGTQVKNSIISIIINIISKRNGKSVEVIVYIWTNYINILNKSNIKYNKDEIR